MLSAGVNLLILNLPLNEIDKKYSLKSTQNTKTVSTQIVKIMKERLTIIYEG